MTVPPNVHRRGRPQLRFHRSDRAAADVVTVHGLAVTSISRTLLDLLRAPYRLAAVWTCEAALRAGLLTVEDLRGLGARVAGRSFAARVRHRIARVDPGSESPLETAIRLFLADAALPPLVVQFVVRTADGHVLARLDLAAPEQRAGGLERAAPHLVRRAAAAGVRGATVRAQLAEAA